MLCKKTGMTERQVQVWFRKRRKDSQASDLKRLSDAGYIKVYYLQVKNIYVKLCFVFALKIRTRYNERHSK